MGENDL